jgi:hypothetical protein
MLSSESLNRLGWSISMDVDAGVILSVRKETHAQVETLALLFSPMRFLLEETIGALCAFT